MNFTSNLTLGFSPCPNDTFIFDAMVHHKIDTEGLEFDVVMDDVESLNQRAFNNEIDITKVSFATFAKITEKYVLLNSGSALGNGVGPLVIRKRENGEVNEKTLSFPDSPFRIAIPGKNTTANFLFSIFFPRAIDKVEMIFSDIENALLTGSVDAGVIIHENRFTYQQKGLVNVCDLGELWEKKTGEPIPLGGIVVKRNLPHDVQEKIDRVLRKSVEYAFSHPESSRDYVKKHAQEMEEDVRNKHINLYVNQYSIDLGETGRHAVETLFDKALESGIISSGKENIFMPSSVYLSAGK